jgi:GH24 family phage-related lysozyme (muramidase)
MDSLAPYLAGSYIAQSIAQLKIFEGSVAWMYRDTVGLITVGVGNMLPDVAAALKLPFRVQSSGELAGETAVRQDFARVQQLAAAKLPKFYYEYESLILAETDIDALLVSRLQAFEAQLRQEFPRYDTFPDPAKIALMDMAYSLGDAKLRTTYHHLDQAVFGQDWGAAAGFCGRNVHNPAFDARNDWTRDQFLAAEASA